MQPHILVGVVPNTIVTVLATAITTPQKSRIWKSSFSIIGEITQFNIKATILSGDTIDAGAKPYGRKLPASRVSLGQCLPTSIVTAGSSSGRHKRADVYGPVSLDMSSDTSSPFSEGYLVVLRDRCRQSVRKNKNSNIVSVTPGHCD